MSGLCVVGWVARPSSIHPSIKDNQGRRSRAFRGFDFFGPKRIQFPFYSQFQSPKISANDLANELVGWALLLIKLKLYFLCFGI